MGLLGEVDVEIDGATRVVDAAPLLLEDVDLQNSVADLLPRAVRPILLLRGIMLVQPEGTQKSLAARAAATNLEPAVLLRELVQDLVLGRRRAEPMIGSLYAQLTQGVLLSGRNGSFSSMRSFSTPPSTT
jgi:hypothetical protein